MPDPLFLNLWFSDFPQSQMLPRAACIFQCFPFSATRPGIGHVSVHSISWSEAALFEETFDYRAMPEHALSLVGEFLHDDNAYVFEAMWDLWSLSAEGKWQRQPHPVKFVVHGENFAEGIGQESGHIQIDLGLDSPFLIGEDSVSAEAEQRVRQNIQQLVSFTSAIEKNCGVAHRLLWSESDENLAQKLVAGLQRLQ
jgi:hypothetical protein